MLTFSGAENARLEGVTVQGGQTAAILVNGASVTLENSALKPQEGAGASITYQADSKLPSLTLNNVEASPETNLLYISPETLEQIGTLGSTEDMEEIMEQVRASIGGSDRVDLTYDEDSGSASAPAPVRHAVTLEAGKNGSLSADRTQVQSGEVVTLTVTPEKGYRLEKLEARDGQDQVVKLTREEDGTYTFTMPESPVTVSAVFGTIFQDVAESDWFYAAVQYVYEQGIMSGVEEGRFEPGTTLTRAMLAQTLYAMEGKPQLSGGEDFSDVEEGDWYAAAVAWAAENGLTDGLTFTAGASCPRSDVVYCLWKQLSSGGVIQPVQPSGETQEETAAQGPTAEEVYNAIVALKSEYPEGMRWTNDNFYRSDATSQGGYGCEGFALICSDAAFGELPVSSRHSNFDAIRVGDLLRINNDTHTVVVLEKRDHSVVVTEGNFNSSIHWNREISRSSLEQGNFTVRSRYPAA